MQATDYKDLEETPEQTATATTTLARNTAHLARLLQDNAFPGQ